MRRHTLLAVALAASLALAGCAGSTGPAGSTAAPTDGATAEATGTVQFYVSDQPTAIDEFDHLNVTITEVTLQRADEAPDEGEDEDEAETNENEAAEETETIETPENETEGPEEPEAEDSDDEREGESRVTVDVEDRTVDLTRLKGDNATFLGDTEVPAGNYTAVFMSVSEVNATLTTGESVRVKLPSERLKLTTGFTLEPNATVDFVYDITVVKAGNSGKYILTPVVSESGPDQPITEVGDRGPGDREDRDREDEDAETTAEREADEEEETDEPGPPDGQGQG